MIPFLAAQAAAPFDPAPMLIHADWLEERGDLAGAAALRGLAAAGYPSLVGLALGAGSWGSVAYSPDGHAGHDRGNGVGDGHEPGPYDDCAGEKDGDGLIWNHNHGGLGCADSFADFWEPGDGSGKGESDS